MVRLFLAGMLSSLALVTFLEARPYPLYEQEVGSLIEQCVEDKISKTDGRYASFCLAIRMMHERGARTIVETGTSRGGLCNCAGDGCGTMILGDYALQMGATLYSVDISAEALAGAARDLGERARCVHLVQNDSVAFLQDFNQPIDLLYLDSYDFEVDNPLPSQLHHLKEIQAAYHLLKPTSIVMIDDCGHPYGGKGGLAVPYLLERGWRAVYSGHQIILARRG